MSRFYSVSLQSDDVPVGFQVVTIPRMSGSPERRLADLGMEVHRFNQQPDPDTAEVSTLLANLVTFDLWYAGPQTRRAQYEPIYERESVAMVAFTQWVANETIIPVESSPLHGDSLDALKRNASLTTFATVTEAYSLMHHDPLLVIMTPAMTIVIAASIGAGEALRDRIRAYLSPARKPRLRKKQ